MLVPQDLLAALLAQSCLHVYTGSQTKHVQYKHLLLHDRSCKFHTVYAYASVCTYIVSVAHLDRHLKQLSFVCHVHMHESNLLASFVSLRRFCMATLMSCNATKRGRVGKEGEEEGEEKRRWHFVVQNLNLWSSPLFPCQHCWTCTPNCALLLSLHV